MGTPDGGIHRYDIAFGYHLFLLSEVLHSGHNSNRTQRVGFAIRDFPLGISDPAGSLLVTEYGVTMTLKQDQGGDLESNRYQALSGSVRSLPGSGGLILLMSMPIRVRRVGTISLWSPLRFISASFVARKTYGAIE